MTLADYARHRGVSKQAISKNKKIPRLPNGKVDVVAADRALGEARERITIRDEAPESASVSPEPFAAPRPAESAGLTKARTATEVYNARLKQLEYEERTGKLINAADAAREWGRTLAKLVADTETFLFTVLARDLAEHFGLDWKAVSVRSREAYRNHRAGVAREAQAELNQHDAPAPAEAPPEE